MDDLNDFNQRTKEMPSNTRHSSSYRLHLITHMREALLVILGFLTGIIIFLFVKSAWAGSVTIEDVAQIKFTHVWKNWPEFFKGCTGVKRRF